MFKKLLAVLLTVVLIVSVCPLSVIADNTDGKKIRRSAVTAAKFYNSSTYAQTSKMQELVDVDEFKEFLLAGLKSGKSTVSVYDFGIPQSDENMKIVSDFIYYNFPEAFHVTNIWFSWYDEYFDELEFITYVDAEDYPLMYNQIVAAGDVLLDGIEGNSSLTQLEKALLIHDRLALWNEYDYSAELPKISHSAYGALVNRTSVCDGYTRAYTYLLGRVGIKSEYISSDLLNHAWNIVYINGVPYHVDVTWDDGYDKPATLLHENFLRSNEGIKATGHHKNGAVDYATPAKSTTYDNYFWQDIDGAFQLADNSLYFIDNSDEKIKKFSGAAISDVHSVAAEWEDYRGYVYENSACLGSNGDVLFYSSPEAVYSFEPETNATEIAFAPTAAGDGSSIWEFKYEEDYFICYLAVIPYADYTVEKQYYIRHDCNFKNIIKDKYLVSAASCIKQAVYCKSCEICGIKSTDTFKGDIDTAVHSVVSVPYSAAQIGVAGNISHDKCTDCQRTFIGGREIDPALVIIPPIYNEGWVLDATGWWYRYSDGSYAVGWAQIGGSWYYFNPSGYMCTGWVNDNGTWYYMTDSGAMHTGWLNDGGVWYYLDPSGAMATGWVNVGGIWYYMNSSGAMHIGWLNLGGTWYYMNGSGAMHTGWLNLGGIWYYFYSGGAMATGWVQDCGVWYLLDSSGAWIG